MKAIIIFLALTFLIVSCDNSNIVNPVEDASGNFEKMNNSEDLVIKQDGEHTKAYKNLTMLGKYYFNPSDLEQKCGGYLDSKPVKYSYETETERYLRNLNIYCPSTLKIGNKTYKTFNIYSINRYEILSLKGAVIVGTTWGTFKVVLQKSANPKEEKSFEKGGEFSYEVTSQNPIFKRFGSVLLKGKFDGVINKNKTEIEIVGKGLNKLKGGKFLANEKTVCAGDFCWKSDITGNIKVVEKRDK